MHLLRLDYSFQFIGYTILNKLYIKELKNMFKIFKEITPDKLEHELNKFEKEYIITNAQYSTCYYNTTCSNIWHCCMVTYQNK